VAFLCLRSATNATSPSIVHHICIQRIAISLTLPMLRPFPLCRSLERPSSARPRRTNISELSLDTTATKPVPHFPPTRRDGAMGTEMSWAPVRKVAKRSEDV
jgi:hypothetical protein